jgi:hypothetical protein
MWKTTSARLMMTLSLTALLSGCVTSGDYCDIASIIFLDSDDTVSWLLHNDRNLLTSIVVHNEITDRLCWSEGP